MKSFKKFTPVLIALALSLVTFSAAYAGPDDLSSPAPAAPTQNTTTTTTTPGSGDSSAVNALSDICKTDIKNEQGQLKIFSVGVKCFESIVDGLAEQTIVNFSDYLQQIVYTMLIIYLILYGAKVSLGFTDTSKLKSDFMIHALKILFVTWLVFSYGLLDIYGLVISSYHSLITIVLESADFGECNANTSFSISTGSGTEAIWATMDCMFSKFIGWEAKGGYGVPWTGVPLLFGFISSKVLPANGFFIGGLLFGALMTLVLSFFRLAFVYILSMIAMILLFSIGPLMIPMMLFPQTKSFFEGWYKLIISMVLQPVILFAFFAFIATLLTDTITRLQQVFSQLKPAFQLSGVDRTGTTQSYKQIFDMVGSNVQKITENIDKEALLNGITTLVIAFLLASFIKFVSRMALELAGTGTAPELATVADSIGNKLSQGKVF